jgi:hypothetical protein
VLRSSLLGIVLSFSDRAFRIDVDDCAEKERQRLLVRLNLGVAFCYEYNVQQ